MKTLHCQNPNTFEFYSLFLWIHFFSHVHAKPDFSSCKPVREAVLRSRRTTSCPVQDATSCFADFQHPRAMIRGPETASRSSLSHSWYKIYYFISGYVVCFNLFSLLISFYNAIIRVLIIKITDLCFFCLLYFLLIMYGSKMSSNFLISDSILISSF